MRRLVPHEYLSGDTNGNNRRLLDGSGPLSSIDKAVEHSNAVTNRVIATVLNDDNEQKRAATIEKWIDVAQECRHLKNFSAVTAILNGLLSGPVYRLQTAWSRIKLAHRGRFKSLEDIFGSCQDKKKAREILDKVSEHSNTVYFRLPIINVMHVQLFSFLAIG